MHRSPLSRACTLVAALCVAFSAPGTALAHGVAHHADAHHAEAHHTDPHAAPVDHVDADRPSELQADHPAEHGHQTLGPATTSRTDALLVPLAPVAAPFVATIVEREDAPLALVSGPFAGPPEESPRQPRAPPLG